MPTLDGIRDRIKDLRRVPGRELRANPRNWRTHPPEQREALRGLVAEVGVADALLARETPEGLILIDGHLRLEEWPDQDWPVLVLDVTEEEADKLLVSLDPLAAMAQADAAKLADLTARFETESEALRAMVDEVVREAGGKPSQPEPGAGGDEFDQAGALQGECRVKPGELWRIGPHRLLCGDSTNAEAVARLMGGERAALCFTSPPYAQQREYGEAAKEKVQDWHALMCGVFANLPMTDDGQVLVNLGLVHRDGEWVPYWDGWIEWMRTQGWRRFGWYVWDQGYGLPGDWCGRLAPSHEFVFHFNREPVKPEKTVPKNPENVRDRTGDTTMRGDLEAGRPMSAGLASLQTHKIPDSVFRVQRQCGRVTKDDHHPAVFPVDLPATVMQSWPGDVYDPFLGSGTSIIAAHRTGRRAFGMEIEPRYASVVLARCEAEGLTVERAGP